ncbi:cupredoxin domain-containing protein [Paenibacillus sp. BR2-3]|uniref:cupredoxin domain-containing protein n=1 Tax=Paenibacillus sp. BR2-3 TaxID=3048494 RepID=UPI003977B917
MNNKIKSKLLILSIIGIFLIAAIPLFSSLKEKLSVGSPSKVANFKVITSMAGFDPYKIKAKAGQTISIELVNNEDIEHHFGSDELNFSYKVPANSSVVVELVVDKAGDYLFFCDVCCGGKKNPSMQGRIVIS